MRLLGEAAALYRRGFYPDVRPIEATKARVQIATDDLDAAAGWARERSLDPDHENLDYLHEYEDLTLARLVLAQEREGQRAGQRHPGQLGEPTPLMRVLALLGRLHDAAADTGRDGSLLEIRMLQALALAADGDRETALSVLGLALTQTPEPEGHVRLFLDEGDPMLDLLRDVARVEGLASKQVDPQREEDQEDQEDGVDGVDQEEAVRARQLLERAETPHETPTLPQSPEPALAGPLSQREVEVLRLLDSDLTGPQIADELYVTLNTLRTHTKRIFTKLDVTTRAAAVRKAHEHRLI